MSENITQRAAESSAPVFMELYAQKARLLLRGERELLSAGMTGVVQIAFTCSEDWDGLRKTAVFSNGALTVDVPEENWQGNVCPIPQQVLAVAGKTITVGLYGTDGDTQVLPTVWCALGRVEPGAAPSYSIALTPEAPIWEQLHKRLGEVEAAAPFTVQVVSMSPKDDDSVTVSLNHGFAQIEAAYRTGHLVVMEMFGANLPMTRLITGNRAEFTGPVFTTDGAAYYTHCVVPDMGEAVMYTLPIDTQSDGPGVTEAVEAALAKAKASGDFDGAAGPQGPKGDTGPQGPAYVLTETDQEALVQQVITVLGLPVFGTVDADNNIILTGGLADGTYTLKYESAKGDQIEIGMLTVGAVYTNLADPTSTDWATGQRINSSGALVTSEAAISTNYIPLVAGDVVRVKGLDIRFYSTGQGYASLHFYDGNKTRLGHVTPFTEGSFVFDEENCMATWTVDPSLSFAGSICYARFVGMLFDGYAAENVIITVNAPIE